MIEESFLERHERLEREHPWQVLPRFADGALGGEHTRERIGITRDADGAAVTPGDHDADDLSVWRRPGDVTGWAVVCTNESHGPAGMALGTFDRAAAADDAVEGESYFAPLMSDVVWFGEDPEVASYAGVYRDRHLAELDTMRSLRNAATDARNAQTRLDTAVGFARSQGKSWTEIGVAVNMSRQGARQRWADKTARLGGVEDAGREARAERARLGELDEHA